MGGAVHIHVVVRGQLVRIVLSLHLVSPKEQLITFYCRILYPLHSKISLAEFSLNFFKKLHVYVLYVCGQRRNLSKILFYDTTALFPWGKVSL